MKSKLVFLIPILFYSFFLFSQDYRDRSGLCKELHAMVISDQKYRGSNMDLPKVYSRTFDSIISSKGLSEETLSNFSKLQQGELRSQALQIAMSKRKSGRMENDSLRVLQTRLDEENTTKLIRLVKESGWLTAERLGCQEKFQPVLVFRHAPKKYWKEIRALIEKEKSEKRLSEYEYSIIDNHLNGRPPVTEFSGN